MTLRGILKSSTNYSATENPQKGLFVKDDHVPTKKSSSSLDDASFPSGDHVRVSNMPERSSKVIRDSTTSFGELPTNSGEESFRVRDDAQSPKLNNKDPRVNLGSTLVSQVKNTNDHESPIVQSVEINTIPKSYAGAAGDATKDQTNVTSNFCSLVTDKVFDGVNISIPRKVVEKVSLRFENTLYGYFIGKRMAFPVVEYYVKNNWAKYGLKRIMMNAKGFFFFKFDSRAGLDAVLEGGPWMVCNSPIILKKWSMKTSLQKEELTRVPIWVKLHNVPIQVFEEDVISLIATYLRKPIMLNSYTSSMCIPDLDGPVVSDTNITNDGFQKAVNRKRNNKGSFASNKLPKGVSVCKGFQVGKGFAFQPKASIVGSNANTGTRGETSPKDGPSKNTNDDAQLSTKRTNARQQDMDKKKISNIASLNPFAALGVDDDEEEEVENIWDEFENLNLHKTGASTPAQTVFDV
ncbi:zinc knuckle CX2CX4HX4C containing protein [Tanacetum coccineum]